MRPHALHRPPSRRAPVTALTGVRPGGRTRPFTGTAPGNVRREPGTVAPAIARAPVPSSRSAPRDRGRGGLAAVATVGGPALWVTALAQAPAGTVRGLVLAAGWLGLASVLDRSGRRRRR